MTYDDWKTTEPDDRFPACEICGEIIDLYDEELDGCHADCRRSEDYDVEMEGGVQ